MSIGFTQKIDMAKIDTLVSKAKSIYYASPDSAMILANRIIALSESINYSSGKFEGLRLVGNSHFLKGRLDSAAYYMFMLLDLAYEANDLGMQADVMIDIGQTYDKIGLHSLAYDYFWQSHNIRLKTGNAERLSITFINLAYHYYLRDQLDSALYFYDKTEIILDTIPLTYTKPFLFNELGGVYFKQGKVELAREYIQKAINLNIHLNNNWDLSFNYIMMANIEMAERNINKAEEYANLALKTSKESNISIENDLIYKILSDVKKEQGLFEKALEYIDKSYSYSDSLDQALNDQKILALDQYKREKENEISKLKLTNENLEQESRLRIQTLITAGALLILAITIVQLLLLFRQNKKLKSARMVIEDQNADLKDLNQIKSKLFSIITHDIRNPLSNINGMLKLAKDGQITREEFNTYAGSLLDQTDKLNKLSETLINWSKSQQKGLTANLESIDLDTIIVQSISYVKYMADSKDISIEYKHKQVEKVKADPNMLMLIFNNLLTNAIKFTPQKGKVLIEISELDKYIEVQVKDTGIGINSDLLENIKEGNIETQIGTDKEKGSGVGLLLTLDLIAFNGGKLWAENNEDGGSSFYVSFPIA